MDAALFLKALRITAAFGIFAGIGMLLSSESPATRKSGSIIHGIALLVSLLLGFAMLKKPPMDQHWWMVKVLIWLFLGAVPVLIKRKVLPTCAIVTLCLIAGFAAAWLGLAHLTHPF